MEFTHVVPAAQASTEQRALFIRLTYLHLGLAILGFVGIEVALFTTGLAETLTSSLLGTRYGWLLVLGGFMGVSWLANRWAQNLASMPMQYLGLSLYVVAEAILFAPLLFIAAMTTGPETIPIAGLMTAVVFTGLTGTVFLTGKNFSFLGKFLMFGGIAAIGLIVCAILFGFSLGLWFSFAMVGLAAGYILYYTSKVLHEYPVGAHVAASLALFASVALLFWYILRILMAFSRR